MDDEHELGLHSLNHHAQKSVVQSAICSNQLAELGTKLGDSQRGFVLFIIGPDEDDREPWMEMDLSKLESRTFNLHVGVQTLVDPTFEELRCCVSKSMRDATHSEDVEHFDDIDESMHCDWDAVAESWLDCGHDDIMAVAVGPFMDLGFSVYCFERGAR